MFAGIGLIAAPAPAGCAACGAAVDGGVALDAVEDDGAGALRQAGRTTETMNSSANNFLMCVHDSEDASLMRTLPVSAHVNLKHLNQWSATHDAITC